MAGRLKVLGTASIVAAALMLPGPPAHAQMGKKGSHAAAPKEDKPKVDDKAYKEALKRIPEPKKPYDPWGQVHDNEPAAKPTSVKSN